jgi:hypothetical protein
MTLIPCEVIVIILTALLTAGTSIHSPYLVVLLSARVSWRAGSPSWSWPAGALIGCPFYLQKPSVLS